MKNFLLKLVIFFIAPLLFVFTFDIYLRNKNTLSAAKYGGLIAVKKDVEVLFLGNSHANYAIDPSYFENFSTYNLANVSQKIYFDKRLLIKSIDDGVSNLKYVFISVDYHSLYTSSQGVRNAWTYYANGIKYKDQNYTKAVVSPFIWGYTPKVSFSLLFKDIKRKLKREVVAIDFNVENGVSLKDSLQNGFIGFTGQNEQSFNNSNYEIKALSFREDLEKNERKEVVEDLRGLLAYLKNQNIEPILYSSPTFLEYNTFLNTKTIEKNLSDINALCQEFNIQYWRYNDDDKFIKEDFFNQDHLNKNGAKKFSSMLNLRLQEYHNNLNK